MRTLSFEWVAIESEAQAKLGAGKLTSVGGRLAQIALMKGKRIL